LLSKISGATPKIADYPFTTLHPILGVINQFDEELVLADIPGLIDGVHEGKGLGDQFLAHIERCQILLHILDCSDVDIVKNYRTIKKELKKYGKNLNQKKVIIALSKIELMGDKINDVKNIIEKETGKKPILFQVFQEKE